MADSQESVEDLFCTALDLPPGERGPYLDRVCAGAPHLRRMVEELLHEDARAGSFLAGPLMRPSASPAVAAAGAVGATGDSRTPLQFSPDQVLANRFVVTRFIAHGGMGEVYEVQDTFLHNEAIALKIIRPDVAGDAGMSRRFEQEVLLARKVVHPNLCPIYDIFRSDQASSSLFLTMKLLRGETLAERLRRPGSLTRAEIELVSQELIAGIAAMHAAGVIHRDLKPNNVMLEPSGGQTHAVIMDFGLARLHASEFSLLGTGLIAGTPGYLAPELYQGQQPTQASDIFALGVVLHQLITGERPRGAREGPSQYARPSLDRADVPPALIAAVKSFLSDVPAERCTAFDRAVAGSRQPLVLLSRPLMSRRAFAVASGAFVIALAGGAVWQRERIYDVMHPLPRKRFVALLTWPPPAEIQVLPMLTGLIDAMADGLSRAEAFDHDFFVAAGKSTEVKTPAQMNELRESLGANLVLATSGRTDGHDVQIGLHVLDPVSGRTLRSREISAKSDEVLSLPARVVRAAAELLDVDRYEQDEDRNQAGTGNLKALAAFQQAELLRNQDNDKGLDAAIAKYKEALELDPHYAEAQARLGWAYIRLYGRRGDAGPLVLARENLQAAAKLDPDLMAAHLGLAWLLQMSGNHVQADRELAKALSLDPSNAGAVLTQANFYVDEGQYAKAEEAYRRAVLLRPNFWFGHNALGALLNGMGKYDEALKEFQAANLAAPTNVMPVSNIASVLLQIGNLQKAAENAQKSFRLSQNDQAAAVLAEVLRIESRYDDALKWAQVAVDLNAASAVNWIESGDCYVSAGRPTLAMSSYDRARKAEEEELRNAPKLGSGWVLLAFCCAKMGDAASALNAMAKAQSTHGDDLASQLLNVRTLELLGKRDEAIELAASCIKRGATSFQLENTLDLQALLGDPHFAKVMDKTSQLTFPALNSPKREEA